MFFQSINRMYNLICSTPFHIRFKTFIYFHVNIYWTIEGGIIIRTIIIVFNYRNNNRSTSGSSDKRRIVFLFVSLVFVGFILSFFAHHHLTLKIKVKLNSLR